MSQWSDPSLHNAALNDRVAQSWLPNPESRAAPGFTFFARSKPEPATTSHLHLSHSLRSFRPMNRFPANPIRRIASTFFVFLALFVVCAGVQAMPCGADDAVSDALHAPLSVDLSPDTDDGLDGEDLVSSLEDNNNGLDDTFDVPPEHAMSVPRLYPDGLPGLVPPPHAHARSSELRPPIA